jgi:hypothetical protein
MLDTIAVVILGFAALGGLTAATLHLTRPHVPLAVGIIHGLFAATGLILLFITATTQHGFRSVLGVAILLFVLAATGGVVLFSFHVRRRTLPRLLILLHGSLAISGYIVLLFATF